MVVLAGLVAGVINAVVGAGTLLTYPVLVGLGVPAVAANATNTLGLALGGGVSSTWTYRRLWWPRRAELAGAVVAVGLGAVVGAILVVRLPQRYFEAVVPWLILAAVGVVMAAPLVKRWHERPRLARGGLAPWSIPLGVYGGYFGAASGVMYLAALSWLYDQDLQVCNAAKTLLILVANATAAVVFLLSGMVVGSYALLLGISTLVGGYLGGHGAQRLPQTWLRGAVVVIGLAAAAYTGLR